MPFCNVQCSNRRFKQHIYLPVSTNSTQTLIWKIPKGYATKRLRTNDLPLTRPSRRYGPRHCLPDQPMIGIKIHKKIKKKNYKTRENQKTSSKTLENPKTKSTSLLSFFECQPFHHSKITKNSFFFSSDHFVKGSPSYIFDHHRTTVHVNP